MRSIRNSLSAELRSLVSSSGNYIAILAVLLAYPAMAQGVDTAAPRTWLGQWITSADAPPKEKCMLRLRKAITLQAAPEHFVVHVSADNQFLLMVNGKLVGTGPAHSDLQHWRFETYDLAPFLHMGVNQLAATVWNLGTDAPLRQITDRTAFLMDGDTAAEQSVRSDGSWQTAVDPSLSTLPRTPELEALYYVGSPAERFDGRQALWDWAEPTNPVSAESRWKQAAIVGPASSKGTPFSVNEWQLTPDPLPPMERTRVDSGRVVRVSNLPSAGTFPNNPLLIPSHSKISLLLDRGELTTAFPELTASGGAGAKVKLTYAEALYNSDGSKGNRNVIEGKHIMGVADEFLLDGGEKRKYVPLDWRTWRYLQIDAETQDAPLALDSLETWFTAYPFQEKGSFSSDDPSLTAIWDVGWRTARLCAHDTYMDTPYWERLQYVGDTRVQALISYTVAGDDRLARQAISAFHDSVLSEGITQSRYPSNDFQSIPGFSLYWIGMVRDFATYRSDPNFVRTQMPAVRSTLDWFRARQNGNLLLGRLPWWSFVDWTDDFTRGVPPQTAQGESSILSLQLVEALRNAAALEASVGNKSLALQDAAEADSLSAAIFKLCWDAEKHLLADTPEKKHFSQHANSFAVWLDVIPKSAQAGVMRQVLAADRPHPPVQIATASFYYRFYVARAMLHAGLGDEYLATLEPWKAMLANGLTTWQENPEPTRSDSHAWSSHPNYDLLTIVVGISPSELGFHGVRIEPHLAGLRHLQAEMPSPVGLIAVTYDVSATGMKATINLPAGLPGTLVWEGSVHTLHAGLQILNLPRR